MGGDIRLLMAKQWEFFEKWTPRKTLTKNDCPLKQQGWITDLSSDKSCPLITLLQRHSIWD